MTRIADLFELRPAARDDDEGLFSRDMKGRLVRLDTPTEKDYDRTVTLSIDGQPVTVPAAEPLKDAQGNVVLDIENKTTPRFTTIYDAAEALYVKEPGDEKKIPIPIMCHQPHMNPVAVCRLCVVQIYGQKRGKRAPERKLLPACQHQVKDGMEVFTMADQGRDGERVRQAVRVLTELLTADHLKPAPPPAPADELAPYNELQQMADRVGLKASRFGAGELCKPPAASAALVAAPVATPAAAAAGPPAYRPVGRRGLDASSPVFIVDHSACILCDRCSRACDEVKHNNIIGRVGKGATAGIGFDLNDEMGESGCVQCGECMVSCPTSAITFKPVAKVEVDADGDAGGKNGPGGRGREKKDKVEVLSAAELIADPQFANVPPKFLLWQQGLAIRRRVEAGDVLCRQDEPGNKAFLIKKGRLRVTSWSRQDRAETGEAGEANGAGGFLRGALARLGLGGVGADPRGTPTVRAELTPADYILGEMACLSGSPRTADVTAVEDGEVWEIRRNVLDRLMRSPSHRDRFENIYRSRAIDVVLRRAELFGGQPEAEFKQCVEFLRPRLGFVRVNPGQVIFEQGDWADHLYLVRLGHVRVGIKRAGRETTVVFLGPGSVVGEIGLLALTPEDVDRDAESVDAAITAALAEAEGDLTSAIGAGQRTATCSALDHLELARVTRPHFLEMIRSFPTVRRRLVEMSLKRLRSGGRGESDRDDHNPIVREYVDQGLYQGQSLLVLDLNSCTRCDECTRGCVDQHGKSSHGAPITRLLRDGLQFGDWLVATSCRSCKDAYCMIGCPVDAIHRGKHQQIVIEDHCIGCGLCAKNCPYGNIWMLPDQSRKVDMPAPDGRGGTVRVARPKAAACDLCDADGKQETPTPRCVHACPHDAAHRMTGEELLHRVTVSASSRRRR